MVHCCSLPTLCLSDCLNEFFEFKMKYNDAGIMKPRGFLLDLLIEAMVRPWVSFFLELAAWFKKSKN